MTTSTEGGPVKRYVVRIAVGLDGHPPEAVIEFARDMFERVLLSDPAADVVDAGDGQYTYWVEVTAASLEEAVGDGVTAVREAAHAATGRTSAAIDHSVWPEHAAPLAVEAYAAAAS
jgi:hypothetical protein